jgi:hypothetical protein
MLWDGQVGMVGSSPDKDRIGEHDERADRRLAAAVWK